MSKALFVTRHDISVITAANGNIDNDKILPYINQAQDYGQQEHRAHFRLLPQWYARDRPLGLASSPNWAIRG